MKRKVANKAVLLGVGAGIAMFAVYGLLPGSVFGGLAGLTFATWLFGHPLGSGILARVILAVSTLLGIMGSGIIFVAAGSLTGWFIGTVIDFIAAPEPAKAGGKIKVKEGAMPDRYIIPPGVARADKETRG
ncbi:MAG: hypothetical protein M0Z58_06515 [Nitrospiraceae bacterium]|nr:hypothetical protein [Nitrospiraceae bacterium]